MLRPMALITAVWWIVGRWMVRGGFLTRVGRTMKHDHRLGGKEGSRVEDKDARVEAVLRRRGGRERHGHSKEVK